MNHETRTILLWIDNTEELELYNAAREFVAEHGDEPWGRGSTHEMREWVENTCIWLGGEIPANLQTELTNAAFDAVDCVSLKLCNICGKNNLLFIQNYI